MIEIVLYKLSLIVALYSLGMGLLSLSVSYIDGTLNRFTISAIFFAIASCLG